MNKQKNTKFYLDQVLLVCLRSGTRGMGIYKVLDENKNLMSILMTRHALISESGCSQVHFEEVAEVIYGFLSNLLSALQSTFTHVGTDSQQNHDFWMKYNERHPWPRDFYILEKLSDLNPFTKFEVTDKDSLDECLERVLHVCVSGHICNLPCVMNENRLLYREIAGDELLNTNIGCIKSWCEEFELFFMDLFHVLQDFFPDFRESSITSWEGTDLTPRYLHNRTR